MVLNAEGGLKKVEASELDVVELCQVLDAQELQVGALHAQHRLQGQSEPRLQRARHDERVELRTHVQHGYRQLVVLPHGLAPVGGFDVGGGGGELRDDVHHVVGARAGGGGHAHGHVLQGKQGLQGVGVGHVPVAQALAGECLVVLIQHHHDAVRLLSVHTEHGIQRSLLPYPADDVSTNFVAVLVHAFLRKHLTDLQHHLLLGDSATHHHHLGAEHPKVLVPGKPPPLQLSGLHCHAQYLPPPGHLCVVLPA
mmetsp:Transcript_9761/g.18389  ORF Transcript_9761/g.18389 Transcript_9761/m.18389 type:complete len:253 (-) Transcript_9761:404-1162(-)